MKKIDIKSPAKINLGLRIIRKREDNYHDIETIFQLIDLCDEIELTENKKENNIYIITDHPCLPTNNNNLAYKAAALFKQKFNCNFGITIKINKKIPIAAGLGGGSSNAAAVLKGLSTLWGKGTAGELISLASQIGADVPFFLSVPSAIGTGRGDKLLPVNIKGEYYFVLATPPFEVSAQWAYRKTQINLTDRSNNCIIKNFEPFINIQDIILNLDNDLESAVIKNYPIIIELKRWFIKCGALASSMTGSGATVYGIFDKKEIALKTYKEKWKDRDTAFFISSPIR